MFKIQLTALPLAATLAATVMIAGCGSPSVQAPQPTQAQALSEMGENVIDLKAANGGKFELSLGQATEASRKVLAFNQEVKYFTGTLKMGTYEVPFQLNAYDNKSKISFVNLLPGTWTIDVVAYDADDKPISKPLDDAQKSIYIKAYEIAYAQLYLYLYDNVLNKDSGALKADIEAKPGYMDRKDVMPQWTYGDFPELSEYDWAYFKKANLMGYFTAFSVDNSDPYDNGEWEGNVTFGIYKLRGYYYLAAKLENGYNAPLFKLTVPDSEFDALRPNKFTPLSNLTRAQEAALNTAVRYIQFGKAPNTEKIHTAKHPYGIECQRFFYTETRTTDGVEAKVMSSFYFATNGYHLIQVDYTDGYTGQDPDPTGYDPDFKVVHIQSLDY